MINKVKDVMQEKIVTPKNYINGTWVSSDTKLFAYIFNPSKNNIITNTPMHTTDEINQAFQVAKKALTKVRYYGTSKKLL